MCLEVVCVWYTLIHHTALARFAACDYNIPSIWKASNNIEPSMHRTDAENKCGITHAPTIMHQSMHSHDNKHAPRQYTTYRRTATPFIDIVTIMQTNEIKHMHMQRRHQTNVILARPRYSRPSLRLGARTTRRS